jgi:hypothetical protein
LLKSSGERRSFILSGSNQLACDCARIFSRKPEGIYLRNGRREILFSGKSDFNGFRQSYVRNDFEKAATVFPDSIKLSPAKK